MKRPPSLDKIYGLDALASVLETKKTEGKKIVLCHGVFDLLHAGHILHFKAAKQNGDVLVVSVTPDIHVNKGPNRPYFNENFRLKNLAEIECVDFVTLNQWSTAIETLCLLKPDVYAKGHDYANFEHDVTGNIAKEQATVQELGGKIIFTDLPTMSSSNLLNEFFLNYSEEARGFLKDFKKKYTLEDVNRQLDKLKTLKILLTISFLFPNKAKTRRR